MDVIVLMLLIGGYAGLVAYVHGCAYLTGPVKPALREP